jgi:hypothetical protein
LNKFSVVSPQESLNYNFNSRFQDLMSEALRQNKSLVLKNPLVAVDPLSPNKSFYGNRFTNYLATLRSKKKN